MGQGLLIIEASRSQSDTPHSVGLLWMNDQPYAECYLTTHNTHKRHTSMPPAGIAPAIPASVRPQNQTVDHVATGIGAILWKTTINILWKIYKLIFITKFKYWNLNFKLFSNFCNIPIKDLKKTFIPPTRWRADCVFTLAFITSVEFWEALYVKEGWCSLLLHQVVSERSVCFVNGVLLCIVTHCNILCNYSAPLCCRQDFGWQNE